MNALGTRGGDRGARRREPGATRAATLAVVAVVALTGCPPRAPPPDLSLDPAELLAQVRAAQAREAWVRGEVRVRVDGPGAKGSALAFAAARKPDRVLVQTFDFFGNTAASLATSGGEP